MEKIEPDHFSRPKGHKGKRTQATRILPDGKALYAYVPALSTKAVNHKASIHLLSVAD